MIEINYMAVLIAVVIVTILAMVWYGPLLFGKQWMEVIGVRPDDEATRKKMKEGMLPLMATQFTLTLFQAYVLAHFIKAWGAVSPVEVAVWVWAAFVVPSFAAATMWTNDTARIKRMRFMLQGGYQLLSFIVFGVVLGYWG